MTRLLLFAAMILASLNAYSEKERDPDTHYYVNGGDLEKYKHLIKKGDSITSIGDTDLILYCDQSKLMAVVDIKVATHPRNYACFYNGEPIRKKENIKKLK